MLPALQAFITSVRAVYASSSSDEDRFPKVRPLLAELLADPQLKERSRGWPESNDAPSGCFVNLLFYEDPDYGFVVNALVKGPGESTPVHDHAHSWTLYGVLCGGERVARYRRVDDGADAARAHLVKVDDHVVQPGYIDFVPPHEIHAEHVAGERTVAVIFRSQKVGTFLQNWYDAETGAIRKHLGPVQVPQALE